MEYSRIVAVTGVPGLFEVLSSKSDGAVVRSLEDGSTKFISSRVHNLSHLESIEVYTTGENVMLADVFTAMKSSSQPLPEVKDNSALKAYFETVFPELDTDRVYVSDMKKMVNWFKVLDKHQIDFAAKDEADEEAVTEAEPENDSALNPKEDKVVLDVSADTVPEEGKVKTKKRSGKKAE